MPTVQEQKEVLATLKQGAAAWMLGISPAKLCQMSRRGDLPAACQNPDGTYDARELIRWHASQTSEPLGDLGDGDPLLAFGESPALERYRLARAEMVELDLEERRGFLIPRDRVRLTLLRWASILRAVGDRLGKKFGNDAIDTINEALDDCARVVADEFGNGDSHDDSADADDRPAVGDRARKGAKGKVAG